MFFSHSNQDKKSVIKKQALTKVFNKEIGLKAYVQGLKSKITHPKATNSQETRH